MQSDVINAYSKQDPRQQQKKLDINTATIFRASRTKGTQQDSCSGLR